jgi:hypothetical protein
MEQLRAILHSIPDNVWSAQSLWALSQDVFPNWWVFKAWCYGLIAVLILSSIHDVSVWVRAARLIMVIGALIIFGSLFNHGNGPIGDTIFAIGFVMQVLQWWTKAMIDRHRMYKAMRAAGLRPMTPERALYLAVSNTLGGSK